MNPSAYGEEAFVSGPARGLRGTISVPGDKSISHRALLLGAIAEGTTRIEGLLEAEDCLATLRAIRQLGAKVERTAEGQFRVQGLGPKSLCEPEDILDLGNSGTSTRLLLGLLAGYPIAATLTGDASLRRRPMRRIVEPLRRMGATIVGREGGDRVPLTLQGGRLKGMDYASPVASAQVKSALLLAGLRAEGRTCVSEPTLSRDHSERMLQAFGAQLEIERLAVALEGPQRLEAQPVKVPGDFSSAAFFLVAALIVPESELTLRNIGLNPTRTGLLEVLQRMGGAIEVLRQEEVAGELIGDIRVRSSSLRGVEVGGALVPRMIDEFPILTLAAACAEGRTTIRDARELRYKESDRIAAIARQLGRLGTHIDEREDGYELEGPQVIQPGRVDSEGDHRIGMMLAVAGLAAPGETRILNPECVQTSFPNFFELLHKVAEGSAIR